MKNYLSFGGGVNSVALYLLMQDMGIEFEAVFVDHGGDWPETYAYVDYFIATGRPVTVLKPRCYRKNTDTYFDSIYDFAWDRKLVPSMMARWCTKDFKVIPVRKYVEKPCFMHIGIDADEPHRAKMTGGKGIEQRYLLLEEGIDRQGCEDLILNHGLIVPPKSGCWFCPFQRKAQWRSLRMKHPDLYCKAQKLESRNMENQKAGGKRVFALRSDGVTLDKLINDKQAALPGMEQIEYPPCQCGL